MYPLGYGQRKLESGPRKANRGVAASWAAGVPCKSGSMSTDGLDIFSYLLKIGYTDGHGKKIAIRFQGRHSVSNTTGRHVSLVIQVADVTYDPAGVGRVPGLSW